LLLQAQAERQQGKLDESEQSARKALAQLPSPPSGPRASAIQRELGLTLLLKNDLTAARESLAASTAKLGKDPVERARTTLAVAEQQFVWRELAAARASLEEAERLLRAAGEEKGPDSVSLLRAFANLDTIEGNFSSGLTRTEAALSIAEKLYPRDHPEIARVLNVKGNLLRFNDKVPAAKVDLERALEILLARLPDTHYDVADVRNNLGVVLRIAGDIEGAQKHLDLALAANEQTFGKRHLEVGRTLSNLVGTALMKGEFQQAASLAERATSIRSELLGPDNLQVAGSLNNIGAGARYSGEFARAEAAWTRAATILRSYFPEGHLELASVLNNLGIVARDTGRFALALTSLKESLQIRERLQSPDSPQIAEALHNLGVTASDLGDYRLAQDYLDRALVKMEKAYGPSHHSIATIMSLMGENALHLNDVGTAKQYLNRGLEIERATYGEEHPSVASTYYFLSIAADNSGDHAASLDYATRSFDIYQATLGPAHYNLVGPNTMIAEAQLALGNPEAAAAAVDRALRTSGANPQAILESLGSSSAACELEIARNSLQLAILFCKRAVNIVQAMRSQTEGLDDDLRKTFTDSMADRYRSLAQLLSETGRLAEAEQVLGMLKEEEYFQFIRRDASDRGGASMQATYTSYETEWVRRYEEINSQLASLGVEFAALQARKVEDPAALSEAEIARLQTLQTDLNLAQRRFDEFIVEMRIDFKKASGERLIEFGRKDLDSLNAMRGVLKRLGNGAVLVHYLVLEDKLRILVTTPNVRIHRSVPVTSAALAKKILAFRAALKDPGSDPRALAQELQQLLIAPIERDLQQAKARVLMLYLDDRLRYVPWSALYDGKKYLVEDYALSVFTAAARSNLERAPGDWTVAALGVSRGFQDFAPLPAVPEEIDRIVREGASDPRGVLAGDDRLDDAFTLSAFSDALRRPVVHVASHFRFQPGNEDQSFLLLGDGSRLTAGELRTGPYELNGVDLLTLSACDTGLGGRDADGREIEGLAGLAQNQGAAAVLATLWSVADASTARLMERFYGLRTASGLSKAEALRRAQIEFIQGKQSGMPGQSQRMQITSESDADRSGATATASPLGYRHPYFWAPFILMGNWL